MALIVQVDFAGLDVSRYLATGDPAHLDPAHAPAPLHLTSVVCAIDLDTIGVNTLRYAGNFARRTGAALTIVHALPAMQTLPESYIDADFQADLMEAARGCLAEMQAQANSGGVVCIGAGTVARLSAMRLKTHSVGLVIRSSF